MNDCKYIIEAINRIIAQAELKEQTNEQWFLNFLDELNELSVKY